MKKLIFLSPCIIIEVITEVGRSAKAYCEHTARSIPTLSDTVVTLIEMGESFVTQSRKTSHYALSHRESDVPGSSSVSYLLELVVVTLKNSHLKVRILNGFYILLIHYSS